MPPSGVLRGVCTSVQAPKMGYHGTKTTFCPRPRPRLSAAILLLAGVVCFNVRHSCSPFRLFSAGLPLANGLSWMKTIVRGPAPMRLGPGGGADPVNNVSPEMSKAGQKYAKRYEEIFMAGRNLWQTLKKRGDVRKLYFIGPNGNSGEEVAESVLDALGYVPAPDGTYFLHRKPGIKYPAIKYMLIHSEKKLAEKAPKSAVDLYMEDETQYRDIEEDVIAEFANSTSEFPMACVVGEGAVLRESNVEKIKEGIVVWLDVDPAFSWIKTQHRPQQGGGVYFPPEFQDRPPAWAIANGWDGDVDDTEGKLEYMKILKSRSEVYEQISDIRLRMDIPGISENSYWAAERIIRLLNQHLDISTDEVSVEEEVLEKDLAKFLEGARLSKYVKPALKWCEEQGAATIEEVVDNVPEMSEALKLKPLERKRLEKAAAAVAVA